MKKRAKTLAILAVNIFMLANFAACGKEKEIPEYVTTISSEISDELSSGQFYLDGNIYQLPITVNDFFENGYSVGSSYENADTFTLTPGGQSSMFILAKDVDGDVRNVHCRVYNPTENDLPLSECSVGWFSIIAPADMMFPNGIWSKGTYEDVIAAYGEPREFENDSDTIFTLIYDIELEDKSKWEIEFRMNSFMFNSVTYKMEGMELE